MKLPTWPALGGVLLALACSANEPTQWTVSRHEHVLGTSLELKIAAPGGRADAIERAALGEIKRLSAVLSSYDPDSEFRRWSRTLGTPVPVSRELGEVFSLFDTWRIRSGGAVDAAAETASQLWKSSAALGRLPTAPELEAAVQTIRQPHWSLGPAGSHTATHLDNAPLVLNSFTKSYVIARAADAALAVPGAEAVVVNIGGDIVVRGPWAEPVNITDPRADAENDSPAARILVRNQAVATSGTYRRGLTIAGQWYSHLIDPRTGRPVDHVQSATVVASNATDAGALATALCVLPPSEGLRLAGTIPGAECLLHLRDGTRRSTAGWLPLESARVQLAAVGTPAGLLQAAEPSGPAWDDAFELVVSLELARIEDPRARRPYVAVWIEDKDKFPVRTLALWYSKPKWLPDLKSWNRAEQLRALADGNDLAASVASATRSPGKYTLKWDGKDDKGHRVKPGTYTVFLEVAREHGTHQVMKREMEFAGKPGQFTLPPNVEVSSASLDYRRKPDAR